MLTIIIPSTDKNKNKTRKVDDSNKKTASKKNNNQSSKNKGTTDISIEMKKVGSLYTNHKEVEAKVSNQVVVIPSNASNTVSDISLQQSLQNQSKPTSTPVQQNQPSSIHWTSTTSQQFMDHEKTLVLMEAFVRKHIFHRLKFISSPEMVAFSWNEYSLCQMVCKHFHVTKIEQIQFWAWFSKCINQKLNKKRSEISNIM